MDHSFTIFLLYTYQSPFYMRSPSYMNIHSSNSANMGTVPVRVLLAMQVLLDNSKGAYKM